MWSRSIFMSIMFLESTFRILVLVLMLVLYIRTVFLCQCGLEKERWAREAQRYFEDRLHTTHWSLYCGACYNERMLQRTDFINKIRKLQRTQRNTIGRRSTQVRMTCRGLTASISASVIIFITASFSYQFGSVICLVLQCIKVKYTNFT
jgi:hypothetical protein